MARYRELLSLTTEQREELKRWAQSRSLPAGDVFRARLILALADGMTYGAIKRSLHTTAPTISRWKQRFEKWAWMAWSLNTKAASHGPQRQRCKRRYAGRCNRSRSDGSTHWSVRKLAAEMGVSKSSVHRILSQARLQPHRLERYMTSNDPDFEAKAADIIGLYLEPPQHAAVFCVDEKTAIQALDRLDPVAAAVAGASGTARLRILPAWNAVLICGPGCEDRQGAGEDSETPHQQRVHLFSIGAGEPRPLG